MVSPASQTYSSGPYTGSASGTGAYTLTVAITGGKKNQPITVTYLVTATDVAGTLAAALVAVHPVLGGIGAGEGAPAVGRSGSGPLLDVSELAPGRAVERSVTVANVGTAPGTFVLEASESGSRLLGESLRLVVRSGGRALYSGTLAGFQNVPLGRLAPGEEQVVRTHVALSPAAGNELQGLSADMELRVVVLG